MAEQRLEAVEGETAPRVHELLQPREVRSVYLITYSQANLDAFPTREHFANLILEAFERTDTNAKNSCDNWPPVVPSAPELVESAEVPNVGRFKAYSTGAVHVVFADRAILMTEPSLNTTRPADSGSRLDSWRSAGEREETYRLILPSGVCVSRVSACNPQGLER